MGAGDSANIAINAQVQRSPKKADTSSNETQHRQLVPSYESAARRSLPERNKVLEVDAAIMKPRAVSVGASTEIDEDSPGRGYGNSRIEVVVDEEKNVDKTLLGKVSLVTDKERKSFEDPENAIKEVALEKGSLPKPKCDPSDVKEYSRLCDFRPGSSDIEPEGSLKEENVPEDDGEDDGKTPDGHSHLKRRCNIMELSFVPSPKRGNFVDVLTPKGIRRSNLMDFTTPIAFDFSQAARTAEVNGGIAEVGSFVFSSAGEPISDVFDLSVLEKIDTSCAGKEKYTRVSFIAKFDPYYEEISAPKKKDNAICEEVPPPLSKVSDSPLISGLQAPHISFAKPRPPKVMVKEAQTQTEDLETESFYSNDLRKKDELLELTLEEQRCALLAYEAVLAKIKQKISESPLKHALEFTSLKQQLAKEKKKNSQLEETLATMMKTMQSTLMSRDEVSSDNTMMKQIIEEQMAMLEKYKNDWEEVAEINDEVAKTNKQISEDKERADEMMKTIEKQLMLLKIQGQAKDDQIEALKQQEDIMKSQLESLRRLMEQVSCQ